ncbi:DUF2199 domain-containing protein [Alloacidobacterium dinghuense]|uniref:DUF2199 domain-containing protein n=1 Tax=Alloacidobacterium dinghuense TaxID=2763107 RepID=A0A7G8BGW6_9BACT|nr:DUF2199 domain-containing protein [Alloacidobacterium dinghuense]QNI31786.1 DUF2199 domain-containing protein [Alloacidobacterium dinghuense]
MGSELKSGFACRVCGERHDVLPLSYSVKAPVAVTAIPPDELEKRVVITPDQCVIDSRDFYLRGRIVVPVIGTNELFVWGVWAEISPKNFIRANGLWNTQGREMEPAFPGWLNTELFPFGNTINLEVNVHTQPIGWRPHFTVSDPDHPLGIEQRSGITLERVEEIAEMILHPRSAAASTP